MSLGSAMLDTLKGRLPDRYDGDPLYPYNKPFYDTLRPHLQPGMTVLDVGSGRVPAVGRRPSGWTYVGFDIDADELALASEHYDEARQGDITVRDPALEGRFDLVVSKFLLEHVQPIDAALENMRAYLKPGGRLVSMLPGRYALFSLANRVVPRELAKQLLLRANGRNPDTVFPAFYDRCWHSALTDLLASWSEATVEPCYLSAHYLGTSKPLRPLQAIWVGYEEWSQRRPDLASYYVIDAKR